VPIRNRFFYGKLLDVFHFELEQDYFNRKRWLLNRLITGYGVVCGLDVRSGPRPDQVVIMSGVAIDMWGREIYVTEQSVPYAIPEEVCRQVMEMQQEECPPEEACVHVSLCYCEQAVDPVPTMAEACSGAERCAPGAIRESYNVRFHAGKAPPVSVECHIPDVISRDELCYAALVKWITRGCPGFAADPCIPLADLYLVKPASKQKRELQKEQQEQQEGQLAADYVCHVEEIDISVRPIVYTNDLLLELLLCLLSETPEYRRGK
jgi:hypothetical protein